MNKEYYIETHMHTAESSFCGSVCAADGVLLHKNAGFDAVIITDHFNKKALDKMGGKTTEKVQNWLKGYKTAKTIGDKLGMDVFLGAEFAFSGGRNEYLLYGITEETLYGLEEMFVLGIKELFEYSREKNILIVQAHPYRTGNNPAPIKFIDGAEGYNGNLRHENNSPFARKLCSKHSIIMTAGGDYHETEDLSYAMSAERKIGSAEDFVNELKKGELEICELAGNSFFKPVNGE